MVGGCGGSFYGPFGNQKKMFVFVSKPGQKKLKKKPRGV